jgi:hypothetical protein
MKRFIYACCIFAAVALVGIIFAPAHKVAASPPDEYRADQSMQLAQAGRARVCCRRGWQEWWTTARDCRRFGGFQTANRHCRNTWNDRWDQRWWGWHGRNWNARVCCASGRRVWWTTARECRRDFGYETANRRCRR